MKQIEITGKFQKYLKRRGRFIRPYEIAWTFEEDEMRKEEVKLSEKNSETKSGNVPITHKAARR